MVKLGDKVRYLNAVGGGKVVRIEPNNIAVVLEDDGFETPVLTRELVVIEDVNACNFPIAQKKEDIEKKSRPSVGDFSKKRSISEDSDNRSGKDGLLVFLAFVPKNVKEMQTTSYDCYLINDSNYYLRYNYFSGDDVLALRDCGELEPHTKIWTEEIGKEKLAEFGQIAFQAVAFKKDRDFERKPVVDVQKRLNLVKFYKLHSFSETDFFHQPAMLIPFVEDDRPDAVFELAKDVSENFFEKPQPVPFKNGKSELSKKQSGLVEVDLHINALLDTTAGMSNADMLECQLRKFNETMALYKNRKGQKIVFIHGKGEGILRKELEKQLHLKYKNCYFQDASFREYGFGATQVTVR